MRFLIIRLVKFYVAPYSINMGELSIISISCPFGPALVEARLKNNISQSRLGILAECNVSSLRRIERGQVQPGVCLAIRLISATGNNIKNFFNNLAESCGVDAGKVVEDDIASTLRTILAKQQAVEDTQYSMPSKAIFGHLFKQFRVLRGISQKETAIAANYNLRNILNVETKGQEPGIMTAIALVSATGCPVGIFFETLSQCIKEVHQN